MYMQIFKSSSLLLGLTAIVCSRVLFVFFNDPEGPNLLIVAVLAAILYAASLVAYRFAPVRTALSKLSMAVFIQILLVVGLYFVAQFI